MALTSLEHCPYIALGHEIIGMRYSQATRSSCRVSALIVLHRAQKHANLVTRLIALSWVHVLQCIPSNCCTRFWHCPLSLSLSLRLHNLCSFFNYWIFTCITYLVKFLLPVIFSSCHGLNAVGETSNNPGRSSLEGNCLAPEINPIQVNRMATQTGWCSACWKAVDCLQGYRGWSEGEWVTPCSSVALVSRRSESRGERRVVGR